MLATERMPERGVVVKVASSAGLGEEPYQSPEYAAAKAGLIRFTTSLGDLPGARVNCVVPAWILTERAEGELAAMTEAERAAAGAPIPMDVVTDAVRRGVARRPRQGPGRGAASGRITTTSRPVGGS